ncbi:DoxX family membrane protein [Tessaracoccus sp. OS52]|uniref:DoxX family protein n=1 Tax=Tessaracoccus sp. OS52 TaxID=2886691 RepID=UPI001D12B123|nr:DoxX family protein [Tessaracoccus sp. OS52]MCC2594398.1 DoxX family membrane protein [Tessaracoccus sp. OS52]
MPATDEGDWVRQGTPRDVDADWNDEQSEYGTALSPAEWDDYSSEQSVPVQPPQQQSPSGSEEARPEDDAAVEGSSDRPVESPLWTDDAAPEGSRPEVSEDAALFGAPLEDKPDLPEGEGVVTEVHTDVPAPAPSETEAPAAHTEPVLADTADERDVEHQESEPAIEEETLDEPVAEEYDEPAFDEDTERAYDEDAPRVSHAGIPDDERDGDDGEVDSGTDAPTADTDDDYDPDATRVVPVVEAGSPGATAMAAGGAGAAAVAAGAVAADGIYRRNRSSDDTAIIDDQARLEARAREADEAEARERELQAQLDAERRARNERLGVVPTSSENAVRDAATAYKVSTDRFFSSLCLFVLRLVTAAVVGIAGYQILTGIDGAAQFLSQQPLIPEPRLVAWIAGFSFAVMALLLVIGMIQRVVGFVLFAVSVAVLVLLRWGRFSVFTEGVLGFYGDRELLLAGIGLVLLGVGGGLWGVDGAFRKARAAARAETEG